MRTNIMLCFLSDVKLDRKTGAISAVDYQNIGEKKECHTTNESAVRYLLSGAHEPADQLSRLFLVRTNKVAGAIQGYNATHDWEQTHYDVAPPTKPRAALKHTYSVCEGSPERRCTTHKAACGIETSSGHFRST